MENVTYAYEKGYGVKNVNFTMDDAEFTFLIGPTGSGKTTIMKLIYMDLLPQSGVVTTGRFRSDSNPTSMGIYKRPWNISVICDYFSVFL